MSKKNNQYSKELKAVNMYIDSGMSALQVAKILNVKCKTQIQRWVKLYEDKGNTAFDEENRGKATGPRKGKSKTKFHSVEEELNYLRMENEFLKKLYSLSEKEK
ncbi:TPA: transposase [Clostridium botulinum]|uniref:helix-turn-helix domain-containing protein n=1 Tax=Clostridium TaxID=1485 RepID=UPI000772E99B|nr:MULTISPECIES: helix-turn-helix domain-containing protein [Clostridium]AUM96126.1 hypothetical protein RSJ11_13580 [Clostridium sporogenes]AVQ53577.1 transposase [Clostridium botulinum]HBJ2613240.1 transposase [Clostridium botulinum]HBJ2615629.1 transposase [Clostridium botulinum]